MSYKRTDDLLELAIWMQANREGVSLDDIMNRYEVSRRTAERMRDMVAYNHHLRVEERKCDDRRKRWYIPQGTLKDLVGFTADNFACLDVAKKLLENAQMFDKAKELQVIIDKISGSIKDTIYNKISTDAEVLLRSEGFAVRQGPKLAVNEEIIDCIRHALKANHHIIITYKTKHSGETAEHNLIPYGFLYGERNHYLVATYSDSEKKEPHLFILSSIKSVKETDEVFEDDDSFNLQEYANRSFGTFQEEPFDVEWLFSADVADDAEHMLFHPTQTMKRNDDGTLTVCFNAGGEVEMDWHLYTWGDDVKVIKPENWYGG